MYENIKKEIKEKLLKDREYISEIKNIIDKIFKEYNIEIYSICGLLDKNNSTDNEENGIFTMKKVKNSLHKYILM